MAMGGGERQIYILTSKRNGKQDKSTNMELISAFPFGSGELRKYVPLNKSLIHDSSDLFINSQGLGHILLWLVARSLTAVGTNNSHSPLSLNGQVTYKGTKLIN